MKHFIECAPKSGTYTSKTVQNNLHVIDICGDFVRECSSAPVLKNNSFFTTCIIAEEVTDFSNNHSILQ